MTLRDVEGWTSGEVCALLELSEANQRVPLHRGRCRVRTALERHKARPMGAHDIVCQDIVEVVTDFLEGGLAVDQRDLFERHLAMCTWCQTYLDQMRHALALAGTLAHDDIPLPVLDALAGAFRAQLPPPPEPGGS